MEFLDKNSQQSLKFVIAGYTDTLVYHEYEYHTNTLACGKPFTEESLRLVFKTLNRESDNFNQEFKFENLIPSNVLRFSTDEKKIIWYTKPSIKKMYFSPGAIIETGCYPVPYLLWSLDNKTLSVYALRSAPKSNSFTIYNAPFMNVNMHGNICMGNAKFVNNDNDYESVISLAETAFFNSYFTHSSHNDLMRENYVEWMQNNISALKFDNKLLVPSKINSKKLLNNE